jgi:hypothetical protein
MIIVQLAGELGNQLFQYACGKSLERRMKTKLIIDHRLLKSLNPLFTPRENGLYTFSLKSLRNVEQLIIEIHDLKNRLKLLKFIIQKLKEQFEPVHIHGNKVKFYSLLKNGKYCLSRCD